MPTSLLSLQLKCRCTAAVSSAYDGRHPRCTTTAVRAAGGRRTTNKRP
ncbi:MAG: hypothetical protein HXL32_01490 [Prevotellaceae bacterium]|nr:hypothetical protein [Prevotellaceae bacterium]